MQQPLLHYTSMKHAATKGAESHKGDIMGQMLTLIRAAKRFGTQFRHTRHIAKVRKVFKSFEENRKMHNHVGRSCFYRTFTVLFNNLNVWKGTLVDIATVTSHYLSNLIYMDAFLEGKNISPNFTQTYVLCFLLSFFKSTSGPQLNPSMFPHTLIFIS